MADFQCHKENYKNKRVTLRSDILRLEAETKTIKVIKYFSFLVCLHYDRLSIPLSNNEFTCKLQGVRMGHH